LTYRAERAPVLSRSRDIDLSPLFPLTSDACATPLVDYSTFDFEGDSCQQLGQQLLPLVYSTSLLFRKFIQLPVTREFQLISEQARAI
jgi:hypothetical protein